METLPDYLKAGLDIVFVGLNPSLFSARVGRYFANPRNRFWAALNRSGLVSGEFGPEKDYLLMEQGIGFTDVVKRPTSQASHLTSEDFRRWAPVLVEKLERFQPLVACFHGVTAYRSFLLRALRVKESPQLGLQQRVIGKSRVFVVPNPSPANASFSLDSLVHWYRELGQLLNRLKQP